MDECCLEEQERGNMDFHNYNLPLSSITVLDLAITENYPATCCRHSSIYSLPSVRTSERRTSTRTWGSSTVVRSGQPCGSTDILMWRHSLHRSRSNFEPNTTTARLKRPKYSFLYFKVKPKQTIVKDLRKKISKNTEDDTGIFMGECKYNLVISGHTLYLLLGS